MYANNPFSLSGKIILVTGASSGIGRATAIACAQMGARIIITGRNKHELENSLNLMPGIGHSLFPADLTQDSEVDQLIENLGCIDGLVSNAGINKRTLVSYIKINDMENILKTNLTAPVILIKKLLKAKKISAESSIVFISSIAVFQSSIGDGVYSASKGAINAFSKVLALELAHKKIRVNTIMPGMVRTKLIEHGPLSEEDYKIDEQKYPLGRYGQPEEIAYAAVYLLSDQTKWMTGSELIIDGGRRLL